MVAKKASDKTILVSLPEFRTEGVDAKKLIAELTARGIRVSRDVTSVAKENLIATTTGRVARLIAVRGSAFEQEPYLDDLLAFAKQRGWKLPTAEDALYLRRELAAEDLERMDLWYLAVMHPPFDESGGGPGPLTIRRGSEATPPDLVATQGEPDDPWGNAAYTAYAFQLPTAATPKRKKATSRKPAKKRR